MEESEFVGGSNGAEGLWKVDKEISFKVGESSEHEYLNININS